MPKPERTIEKRSIKKYELRDLDARRLDKIYKLEARNMSLKQPREVITYVLNNEIEGRKVRLEGAPVEWHTKKRGAH